MRGYERRVNRIEYTRRIFQHVIVPKSKHGKAFAAQKSVAAGVCIAFRVLATVRFDDQSTIKTDEVDDVGINYLLATEFEDRQSAIAQH